MKRALDFTEGSEELPPAKVLCQRDPFHDSMASSSSSFPSSSISSTSKWTYDVFLSFSGEDTRNAATDFVYYAFEEKGIKTFKDDINLERGKTIKPELLKAIKESKFAVVILSKKYASSTWCLDELVEIIDCEEKMELTVLPIFYNVHPSDVRKQIGTFAHAFDEHEKRFKEKVETWKAALSRVADIAGYHVDNSPLSEAIKSIVGEISRKLSGEFSVATEGLFGIETPLLELKSCLALGLKDDVRFIGIWVMGGMGKTTLAEVAYKMFSKEFEASCYIGDVREKYENDGELSLQKDLISQILNDTNLYVKNKCEGEHMIKNRLRGKRIFLVLDDVNDLNQLQKLAGKREWFGLGSRIIITTRDKHLLEGLVDQIYEVKALNYDDALCLFYSIAFKEKQAPGEYLKLSQDILEYVDGVPLALVTLSSFLFGRSTIEWENALKMLKVEPNKKVNQALIISYEGLQEPEKEIFLDIACFFNHEVKDHVVQILEILGRYPHIGLSVLIEKSLLKVSNNELWMHDLLRDMGKDIVRQESRAKPGKRSRLWFYEDIDHVLKNNKGTENVQAMDIRGAEACWSGVTFSLWNPNAFSKMPNLKFLRVRNVFHQYVPEHLPNSLRYLEWSGYAGKSLPLLCFQSNELFLLHLQHSKIKFLWEGMKIFENLKSINMDGSSDLIICPDFNGVQNLEELVLAGCSNLRNLHPSIGKLKKLKLLDLEGCQELTNLPDKFEMESLVTFNLAYCLKVKKFPNTICSLTSLNSLNLFGCSEFDKLPEDLGNIVSLKKLDLSETAIKELPSSVEFLIGLTSLHIRDCKKFDKLPKDLGNMVSLEMLDLSGTAITELPSSIEFWVDLGTLYLDGCPKFVTLPENFGNLKHLNWLYLDGTAIEALPSSVEGLAALKYLKLKDCKNLVRLPSTICNLKRVEYLDLIGCSKIASLPENLGNMESLKFLFLDETAIKELPSSTIHLKQFMRVSLRGCQLSSSSLTSMPRSANLDLSNCNLSAIPIGIEHYFSVIPSRIDEVFMAELFLRGNDFISLPESISQFSRLTCFYLDGCRSLRSLPNIPSEVKHISVDNCTSLERLPELPNRLRLSPCDGCTVQCFNCFKLASNIQNFSNMFQGQSTTRYIIPGGEIPKWFEEVNICDTLVAPRWYSNDRPVTVKKVKMQVPLVGDIPVEIVLCILFLPTERHHRYQDHVITVNGCPISYSTYRPGHEIEFEFMSEQLGEWSCRYCLSDYGKVETHHLWMGQYPFYPPETPGCPIELLIDPRGLEVEKFGFRVL